MLCNVQSKLLKEQTDKVLKCHHEDPLPHHSCFCIGCFLNNFKDTFGPGQREEQMWLCAMLLGQLCGLREALISTLGPLKVLGEEHEARHVQDVIQDDVILWYGEFHGFQDFSEVEWLRKPESCFEQILDSVYMCWMLINWKKRIFELFWTLEMKFSSLWSLQTRILGGLDLGMSCPGACVPVSSNSDGGDLANFRPLGLLGGYGLIALCKISVGKSTVSPVATHSQKCEWISWMDDGNLATIPSPFPCIQTEVISLGRHLHAWQRRGQDFTANSLRESIKFDDNWRSVKLDLRQLQSRHKTLEEDGGTALDPCNNIRSANSHIIYICLWIYEWFSKLGMEHRRTAHCFWGSFYQLRFGIVSWCNLWCPGDIFVYDLSSGHFGCLPHFGWNCGVWRLSNHVYHSMRNDLALFHYAIRFAF